MGKPKATTKAIWEERIARWQSRRPEDMTNSELLSMLGVKPGAPTLFELGRLDTRWLVARVGAEAAHAVRAAIELGRRALRARDGRLRLTTAWVRTRWRHARRFPAWTASWQRRRDRPEALERDWAVGAPGWSSTH